MNIQPFLPEITGDGWIEVIDGNDTARDIFKRHYSYRPRTGGKRTNELIIGPGFKYLLLTADGGALCAWRKELHRRDGQVGVECCIYRRESGDDAAVLLLSAMQMAWLRWPGERLFTFVDPLGVQPTWRASRPTWGHCFYQAGWQFVGLTKKRLHILECQALAAQRKSV
ncbi:hypothetical protein NKH48_03320 [Mesorhizobium sp. M1233]|uniref:hypothetical protein n=1 Tax=Mesorhizobium sp. M1233 TaxID=2957072 RepID=UPI00333CFB30